jgi:Fe-S oxidoreductase
MVRDDYLSLLDGAAVEQVAASAYDVFEFLDATAADERLGVDPGSTELTFHGHCMQTAHGKDQHTARFLRRVGFDVDHLDSSCCGMAGSFGYEKEHYDLSKAIGRILFEQVDASGGEQVVAPGASCRTQLGDGKNGVERPTHPIEVLADAMPADR